MEEDDGNQGRSEGVASERIEGSGRSIISRRDLQTRMGKSPRRVGEFWRSVLHVAIRYSMDCYLVAPDGILRKVGASDRGIWELAT